MPIGFSNEEILQTIKMVEAENLDVRTIAMGVSLLECSNENQDKVFQKEHDTIS